MQLPTYLLKDIAHTHNIYLQRNYASMNAGFKIPDPREFAQAVLEIRFRNPGVSLLSGFFFSPTTDAAGFGASGLRLSWATSALVGLEIHLADR